MYYAVTIKQRQATQLLFVKTNNTLHSFTQILQSAHATDYRP